MKKSLMAGICFILVLSGMPYTANALETEIIETIENIESFEETEETDSVADFVERCYTYILSRTSDPKGKEHWITQLKNKSKTGADIAVDFLESKEFISQNKSDEEYVDIMYHAFLDREPDIDGKNFWINCLQNKKTRKYICKGFIESQEFTNICDRFGIERGNVTVDETTSPVEPSDYVDRDLIEFIEHCYETFLERKPDVEGLNFWYSCMMLDRHRSKELPHSLVFSAEFINRKYTNEQFVDILYQGMFGRDADYEGRTYWINVLKKGGSRESVYHGFSESKEFYIWMKSSLNLRDESVD